ncbi:MAG: hypothetical protein IPJ86_06080 [Bacteroidetes bacterium]|nr:hypothetical protein [Bacteroidota bacterium]
MQIVIQSYGSLLKVSNGMFMKLPSEAGAVLRGLEGNASRVYFETVISHLPHQYFLRREVSIRLKICLIAY